MNKYAPEIASLRLDIEQSVKRKIRTPYDFEFLSGVIWERLHENISPTLQKVMTFLLLTGCLLLNILA